MMQYLPDSPGSVPQEVVPVFPASFTPGVQDVGHQVGHGQLEDCGGPHGVGQRHVLQ